MFLATRVFMKSSHFALNEVAPDFEWDYLLTVTGKVPNTGNEQLSGVLSIKWINGLETTVVLPPAPADPNCWAERGATPNWL